MIDAKAFGAELAGIVKAATAPLQARIDALEKALADRPQPEAGKDADPAEVAAIVAEQVKGEISELREIVLSIREAPDAAALVENAVKSAVADIPVPKDGKDADPAEVQRMVDEAVAAIPRPKDGESVRAEDVLPALERRVDEHLARIPVPKDGQPGKSVTADDVLPALMKRADEYLSALSPVGLADALIDRDGNLVVTMTDGRAKPLGPVIGKDGDQGQDGIGFDDMTLDYDGERTFTFLFQRGERVEERKFVVPVVLDRGVYRADTDYAKGDAVTYGGSVWIAQTDTKTKPDGSADWRLAVKKGRDGRDGAAKSAEDRAPLKVGGRNAG